MASMRAVGAFVSNRTLKALWVVSIAAAIAALWHVLSPHETSPASPHATWSKSDTDAPVQVPQSDRWRGKRVLLLALSVDCPYCVESAALYRSLADNRSRTGLHIVALFPEPNVVAKEFLSRLRIEPDELYQSDFSAIGISGTPTLVLLDTKGRVTHAWVGALGPGQQKQIAYLAEENDPTRPSILPVKQDLSAPRENVISVEQFAAIAHSRSSLVVVDARERAEFARSHLAGSLNIPVDELPIRASHEIPDKAEIILVCDYDCECEVGTGRGVRPACAIAVSLLKTSGFDKVRLLDANSSGLRASGLAQVSSHIVSIQRSAPRYHAPRAE